MDFKTYLAEYLAKCQKRKFRWGKFDCCTFACKFVELTTGHELDAFFKGEYKDEETAYKLLKKRVNSKAKNTPKNVLLRVVTKEAKACGFQEVEHKRYQSGDFCIVESEQGEAMGLICNGKVWCSAPKGLVTLPIKLVKKAWRTKCHK